MPNSEKPLFEGKGYNVGIGWDELPLEKILVYKDRLEFKAISLVFRTTKIFIKDITEIIFYKPNALNGVTMKIYYNEGNSEMYANFGIDNKLLIQQLEKLGILVKIEGRDEIKETERIFSLKSKSNQARLIIAIILIYLTYVFAVAISKFVKL